MELPEEIRAAALEAQRNLEAGLPDEVKRILGIPISPTAKPAKPKIAPPVAQPIVIIPPTKLPQLPPTMETTGLRDAIEVLNRKEKLGGQQRKRLRLLNKELA